MVLRKGAGLILLLKPIGVAIRTTIIQPTVAIVVCYGRVINLPGLVLPDSVQSLVRKHSRLPRVDRGFIIIVGEGIGIHHARQATRRGKPEVVAVIHLGSSLLAAFGRDQ